MNAKKCPVATNLPVRDYDRRMEGSLPLDAQDLKILELEGSTLVGHTCKVIRLAAPGAEFEPLFDSISGRVASVPELNWKLSEENGVKVWTDDRDFRLERHLVPLDVGRRITDEELSDAAGELFSQRLDRDHPLWRIDVAQLDDGGTALIWRIHHALADGTTTMRLAREIIWNENEAPGVREPAAHREVRAQDNTRRRRHLVGLFEREFARAGDPSPFDGQIGTERSIAFATVSLKALHDAGKKAADATLNDSVLSVVAGAIRRWMELHHVEDPGVVRVRVPVSLHHGDHDGGNRDSYFSVPLPLGVADPIDRLKAIRNETDERKVDHDAEEIDSLIQLIGKTSPRLSHLYSKFESNPRRFGLNISNVRGPSQPVSVLEAPVETVHSIVEIGERHALRVAALSVGDRLCFGFCADPDLVQDLGVMADGIEFATERLIDASD
ncbi:MAG: wax ester/triacylglycerol synthase domain-containing protein [Solirubrobacterales bacterium]